MWKQTVMRSIGAAAVAAFLCGFLFTSAILAFDEDFQSFAGAGFAPNPSAGQLDSDTWKVEGMSFSAMSFGDTRTTDDFARGAPAGHVTTGGVYAFTTGAGNLILGIQPTGDDFRPGSVVLRVQNSTGATVTSIDVEYTIWSYNDQDRANYLSFAYATDMNCASPTVIPSLTYTTTTTKDASPVWWSSTGRSTTISGLSIAPLAAFCVRWKGDDAGGSDNRDEYGIDNVSIAPTGAATLIELLSFTAETTGDGTVTLRWETAIELDNAGFNLYRSVEPGSAYEKINGLLIAATAQPGGGARYDFVDEPGPGRFAYVLEDISSDGGATQHGPVHATVVATSHVDDGLSRVFIPYLAR